MNGSPFRSHCPSSRKKHLRVIVIMAATGFGAVPFASAGSLTGPVGLEPDSSGFGILPFEWSGHWGIVHRYGFPAWGQDTQSGSIFMDGNFAHWSRRYAFPFPDRPQPGENQSTVKSAIWYRRGDFSLDEFAFDVTYSQKGNHSTRFQGLKRSFDGQYGLLGPTRFQFADGTIQQNYRWEMSYSPLRGSRWQFGLTYLRTSDAVPRSTPTRVSKGALRSDRIVAGGVGYGLRKEDRSWDIVASFFSQRIGMTPLEPLPRWSADLVSYRIRSLYRRSLTGGTGLFLETVGKTSAMSSDTLGNRHRTLLIQETGLQREEERWSARMAIGGGVIPPDRWALVYEGRVRYHPAGFGLFASVGRSFYSLPFQWNGKPFGFRPVPVTGNTIPTVVPDSAAVSQVRTVAKLGLDSEFSRWRMTLEFFVSRAKPHYTFIRQWTFEMPEVTRLVTKESGTIEGISWMGRINYFRRWWLEFGGLSFLSNRPGWGNGIQHEGRVALLFREFFFEGRLDAGMKLWGHVWGGRRPFVWDPFLRLGYEDFRDVRYLYPQDWSGVINVRFEAVISTFEVAFTMINLLYAGRNLFQNVTGTEISADQLTLTATPLFPAPGRLAFLEFAWRFTD